MPIIKPKTQGELTQKRYRFDTSLTDEVDAYCQWAKIKNDNIFFEEAAMYILKKDRDWQSAKPKLKQEESSQKI